MDEKSPEGPRVTDTRTMIRGLVRAAEMVEQRDRANMHSTVVWDDEVRRALDAARALGWGANRIGRLAAPAGSSGSEFEEELTNLINRHCIESESDTPDFLLAEYLRDCLTTWTRCARRRDEWYGFSTLTRGRTQIDVAK